jgi:hypothetical protein
MAMSLALSLSLSLFGGYHVLAWKKGGSVWDRARRWATMARGIRDVW